MKNSLYDKVKLRKLKTNYYTALSVEKAVIEKVKQIKNNVLLQNEFFKDAENEEGTDRILNSNIDFLMSEDDFIKYIKLVYEVEKENNIASPEGYETTAEWQYIEARKNAENQLINYGIDIMPANYQSEKETLRKNINTYKIRDGLLDGILKLETN